ncbi:MAG: AraC family transcriptional regulator [Myxococcota bacterium]
MPLVRASGLSGYPELVSELGGEPNELLARARISRSALDESQGFVSYASLIRLLEQTATALDCPDFGLQLSTRQDIGILGPLGVAVRNCRTLGEAMTVASRYMFVHSPAISFTPEASDRDGHVLLVYRILIDGFSRAVQVTELSVGLGSRIVRVLAPNLEARPVVHLSHARCAPMESYWSHFEAPVKFGAPVSGLEIPVADLTLPIEDASLQLRELAEDYLHSHHDDPRTPLSVRVRLVVERSFGTGASSCEDVASAFALHPRTLQRLLRREGTTFERLKDAARAELARGYLSNVELPMSQVAALLDYSEQSALTRSCRRWFGRPPRALRQEAALGPVDWQRVRASASRAT